MRSWHAYLRWTLATVFLVVGVVGGLNALIDPLGVFGAPRIAGVNAIKPYLDHHRELARWAAARRVCADTAIFGNSRAEIGFDPENASLRGRGMSAFNHAIPGTRADMSLRQLGWLQAAGCAPGTVILGVEFFDFLGGMPARADAAAGPQPAPRPGWRFLAESVFSINGLRDSLAAVMQQRARHPASVTERGFNPLDNYVAEVEQAGHYVLFRQRAEENVRRWLRKPPRLRPEGGGLSDDERILDAILARTAGSGASVHLVIYPYHAQIRMMLERLGLGDLFAEWKRLVFALAARHAAGGRVEVWDFSGVAPETLEAIPARGDRRTHLKYYWEAGHFKKALGDRMIARMLGEENGFGRKLGGGDIDRWLEEDRARVRALLAEPSALRAEVDDVLARRVGK